jgi:hypothetical protein
MPACTNRGTHQDMWVVLARNGAERVHVNVDLDGEKHFGTRRWVPSNHSSVWCPLCKTSWRTSALYVQNLPDADESMLRKGPIAQRVDVICEEYPLLAELTYLGNGGVADLSPFLLDIGHKLVRYGLLTDRQKISAEGAIIKRMITQAKIDDEHAQLRAENPVLAPNGPLTVVGVIQEVWHEALLNVAEEGATRPRMRVLADEGYTVECTVPAVLLRRHGEEVSGRRVELPITLSRKRDDPAEAWGRYPSQKARLLPEEAQ